MPGIDDIWPSNPGERVRLTIEPTRGEITTTWVADRAEVSVETARRELETLAERGWITQTESDEWRVVADVLNPDGLFPDNDPE